jgi:hypothetical protein
MSFPQLSVHRLVSGMDSSFQALKQRGENGNMGLGGVQRVSACFRALQASFQKIFERQASKAGNRQRRDKTSRTCGALQLCLLLNQSVSMRSLDASEVVFMNEMPNRLLFQKDGSSEPGPAWTKLLALADMIDIDKASGTLVIRNGKSRILLRKDGTVRIEGESIVHSAQTNIALDAAYIDLN